MSNTNTNNTFGHNPFEFTQNFMNQDSFKNMFKNLGDMNNFDMNKFSMKDFQNIDVSALTTILQKNAQALSEAGKMASDSFQSISKKGGDSLQKNATDMFNSMKEAIAAGDVKQLNDLAQKYLKKSVESNISNTKEMMDITSKASMEMMDRIGNNLTDNMNKAFGNTKQDKK